MRPTILLLLSTVLGVATRSNAQDCAWQSSQEELMQFYASDEYENCGDWHPDHRAGWRAWCGTESWPFELQLHPPHIVFFEGSPLDIHRVEECIPGAGCNHYATWRCNCQPSDQNRCSQVE